MPEHWPATVALAVGTAVLTTLLLEVLIKPRIERRNQRRRLAHQSRDRLAENMLVVLSASVRLREFASLDTAAQQAVREDRTRWYGQIDEATCYMVDNVHTYLMTYLAAGGLRDLLTRYAFDARGIMLSQRSMARKGELLAEMTGPAWDIFFGTRLWNVRAVGRLPKRRRELTAALERAESGWAQQGASESSTAKAG